MNGDDFDVEKWVQPYLTRILRGVNFNAVLVQMRSVDGPEKVDKFMDWIFQLTGYDEENGGVFDRNSLKEALENEDAFVTLKDVFCGDGEVDDFDIKKYKKVFNMIKSGVPFKGCVGMMRLKNFEPHEIEGFRKLCSLITGEPDLETCNLVSTKRLYLSTELEKPENLAKLKIFCSKKESTIVDDEDDVEQEIKEDDEMFIEVNNVPIETKLQLIFHGDSKTVSTILKKCKGKSSVDEYVFQNYLISVDVQYLAMKRVEAEFDKIEGFTKYENNNEKPSHDESSGLVKDLFFDAFIEDHDYSNNSQYEDTVGSFLYYVRNVDKYVDINRKYIKIIELGLQLLKDIKSLDHVVDKTNLLKQRLLQNLGKKGDILMYPSSYFGNEKQGYFVLLFERQMDGRFSVVVCSKHDYSYHKQHIDPNTGELKISPVVELSNIEGFRLFNPTFLLMLVKLSEEKSHINNSSVLYESLLPFLLGNIPLLKQESPPPFWCKPGRSKTSQISPILIALRYLDRGNMDWRRFKAALKFKVASELETNNEIIKHVLASCSLKAKFLDDDPLKSSIESLITNFVNFDDDVNENKKQTYLKLQDLSSLDLDLSIPLLTEAKGILNQQQQQQQQGKSTENYFHKVCFTTLFEKFDQASFTRNIDCLVYLCSFYDKKNELGLIYNLTHEILLKIVPSLDLNIWTNSKEWMKGENQSETVWNLLKLSKLYLKSCFHLKSKGLCPETFDGDRLIILGTIYVLANKCIVNNQGACQVTKLFKQPESVCFCLNSIFRSGEFNNTTGILLTTPELSFLRNMILKNYMKSLEESEVLLWDYSKISRKHKTPLYEFELAAELTQAEQELVSSANAFCGDVHDLKEFGALRDIATIFKYATLPLKDDVDLRNFDELVNPIYFCRSSGEDTIEVDTTIQICGEEFSHGGIQLQRTHKTKSFANPYMPARDTFGVNVTEDTVMYFSELPTFDRYISEEECERLFSFITYPYLRIPSIVCFFIAENRSSLLFNDTLFQIFQACLLEPHNLDKLEHSKSGEQTFLPVSCDKRKCYQTSMLVQELKSSNSEFVPQFFELFSNVFENCERSIAPSSKMLYTLKKFIKLACLIEGTGLVDQKYVDLFLRDEKLINFCEKHKLFEACLEAYLFASEDLIKTKIEKLLHWSSRVKGGLIYHKFFIKHCKVILGILNLGGQDLFKEIIAARNQNNYAWKESASKGGCFENGQLLFDILTGKVSVSGCTKVTELPSDIVCFSKLKPFYHSVYGEFESIDSDCLPQNVSNAVRFMFSKEEMIQICMDSENDNLNALVWDGQRVLHFISPDQLKPFLPHSLVDKYTFWYDFELREIYGIIVVVDDDGTRMETEIIINLEKNLISDLERIRKLELHPKPEIVHLFENVENLHHVLFWNMEDGKLMVELTRLGMNFLSQDEELQKFYLRDNPKLFIKNVFEKKKPIICMQGIGKSLIIENNARERFAIIPNLPSVEIVKLNITGTSLIPQSRVAALLIFVNKLNLKEYHGAFDIVNQCATQFAFSKMERKVFDMINVFDQNPNACVCRLKLYEATIIRNQEKPPPSWKFC